MPATASPALSPARRRPSPIHLAGLACLMAAGVVLPSASFGGDPARPAPRVPVIVSHPTPDPGVSSLRIERDPETGGWRLSPLASDPAIGFATSLLRNQSDEGLVQEPLAGAGYVVHLQGRFESYSMARFEWDGRLTRACTDVPAGMSCWLHALTPSPALPAFPEK